METLSWSGPERERIIATPIDQELELYRTLAYVQRVDARYKEKKLYPHLDDLRVRLEQLMKLRKRKEDLATGMKRDIIGLDLHTNELLRTSLEEDDLLRAVDAMIEHAVPELELAMGRGTDLQLQLERTIRVEPIGVIPLVVNEGYLLLRQGREAMVYNYQCPILLLMDGAKEHRVMRTRYVATYTVGLAFTYEQVKADLAHRFSGMPVPALFAFESDITLPRIETFMPLAKRVVYELITGAGGQ